MAESSSDTIPLWWQSRFASLDNHLQFLKINNHFLIYQENANEIQVGFKGPFGGVYSPNYLDTNVVSNIWENIISKGKKVQVRLAPKERFHDTNYFNYKVLINLGFKVIYTEINQNLKTNLYSFNRNRKRDFQKSITFGMEFSRCNLETAYDLLIKNRSNKGLKLSIELGYFQKMLQMDSNLISSYKVSVKNDNLSAAIVLKVHDNYSYVYAWGHDQKLSNSGTSLSFLARNLFMISRSSGIENISLGVSSIRGEVDSGLLRFKESIGATIEKIHVLEN